MHRSDYELQRRLEGIVSSAMDAIISVDMSHRIILFNPAAEKMFACSAEDALGQHINQFIPERFRAEHDAHIREFGEAGSTNRRMGSLGSISGLRSTGEEFPIEASISQVDDGDERLFTVILRDVTARMTAEEALRESRRRLEGIVESAMDAIVTVDEEQKIVLFNPAAERMFGCSAQEAIGTSISRFVPERYRAGHDEHIRNFREAGATNRSMGSLGSISGVRASGEEFPLEASISQIKIGGAHLSTVILRDISERAQSEEAKALLAREVDHRAKNALAVAQALVSLTRADTMEEFVEAVHGRIASLSRAHTLLSKSQWRGAPLEQTLLDELRVYAREDQMAVAGPAIILDADAVQPLSLLFHELATNAVKYGALSRDGGKVAVSWTVEGSELHLGWSETGGPPVEPPTHRGFGSKMMRQVAERQLSARFTVDWDEPGLSVTLALPRSTFRLEGAAKQSPASEKPSPECAGQVPDNAAILLVEDEELVAMEISEELSRLGWAVVGPAGTLQEAQALLDEHPQLGGAVLDVNLHGRAVYPIAETLRQRGVPFLFCTGYELVDPEGRFGDARILRKPVPMATLTKALCELLAAEQQERGGGVGLRPN